MSRASGGSGDPYIYEVVSGFEQVPVNTCEHGPQLQSMDMDASEE
jgi:hypothetical protein